MTRQFKIGDFLKRIKNQIDINDSVKYKRVTVSGNHKGVSLRDEVLGSAIGTKKQFTIKGGNFILSKIDARNGAFGIIPAELDNAIITGNFWTYSVDTNLIDIEWFFYFTHSYNFIQICIESSTGSTHRKYMDEKVFLNHKIILPEIDEQKEMVKKYKTSSKISNSLTSEIQTQKHLLTQLKQSILQEAIQGKLTADWRKQNPNTEPASELLKRIKAEKDQLIKDKKIKKEKALAPITEEEIPFELPEGWAWCRLGKISDIQRGSSPRPKGDKRYFSDVKTKNNWISISDISSYCKENVLLETKEFLTDLGTKYSRFVDKNEFIIAVSGSTTGKCCLTGIEGYIYDGLAFVRLHNQELYPQFLLNYMIQLYSHINNSKEGASFPNINTGFLKNMLYPLMSLEEQKAIVEKVESLMQKCQALEQEIKTSEANSKMLMQAVLKEAFEGKQEVVEV